MVLLKPRVSFYVALILGTAAGSAAAPAAWANPGGATVVQGAADIEQSGHTTTITNTPGTIINWEQFNVAPDEITRFVQQSASSVVLNRVTGSQGSEILGQLLSNGRVFLINPNGIAIGAGATINTAGFVASSLNITNEDFAAGRDRFSGSGAEGRVVNRGTIDVTPGAAVYLIAPNVENHGVIRAPGGEILLAAGHSAELVSAASPNLRVRISAPEGGEAINVGELVANAGRIGLFGAMVRAGGTLDASSASVNARGEIVLSAGGDALVTDDARLDATNSAGIGGNVLVEGSRVAVLEGASVDASGATGGGSIRLGGDYLGGNADIRNASATVIAPTAQLSANALESGDGGRVIVWSDDYTGFHGSISARGGAASGDGGFVETSSRDNLQALGAVDASARSAGGAAGQWLLDPYNIAINAVGANTNGAFNGGSPNLFTPTGNSAVVSRDQIQATLNTGTGVTVATGGTGSPGTQAGTITVNAAIAKTAGAAADLILNAQSTITFNAGATITSTSGALNVQLNSAAGAITNLRDVNLNGGTLTLNSATASSQATGAVISGNTSLIKSGAATFTIRAGQTYTGSTTINAGSLTLGAANALPDATTVVLNGGTLSLANFSDTIGSLAGAGNVSLGSGTLTTGGNNASTTHSGIISGTNGRLVKEGTGVFTLSGANTYTGATTINAGTLQLGAANRIANASAVSIAAGAVFDLNGFAETHGALNGSGSLTLGAGTLTVGSGNASGSFSGVISGTGGFVKSGTGIQTLSGVNTYSGVTSITGGILSLNTANALSSASAVTMSANTTLGLNGFNQTIGSLAGSGTTALGSAALVTGGNNSNTTYSGVISGTGTLTKAGTGILTLSGVNTFSGAINVNTGTLAFSGSNRLTGGNAVTLNAGATTNLANTAQAFGSLAGAGNVTLGSGTLTAGGNNASTSFDGILGGTGRFAKTGTGTLTLNGVNTYTGATTVSGGTLAIGAAERISNSSALNVAAGATFDLNSFSETFATIAGAGNIQLGGNAASGLLTVGNGSTSFSGTISGSGFVTKGGTGALTLSGANTYTGATTINRGTLVAANASALGSTSGDTTVASGAVLRISNAAVGSEAVTIRGNGIGNSGALTGDGAGSLAGPVTLAAASRLGTTNAGSTLTLAGPVDGAFALTISGAGRTVLNGTVGGTTALTSITQGATTPVTLGASITTTGAQNWAGPLTLGTDVTLRSTTNGTLTFTNVVAGNGFDLTANTSGRTVFTNLAGVDAILTDAPGTVTLNGTVSANSLTVNEAAPSVCGTIGSGGGAVSFAGAVALCGDTTVNGTSVNFASTVNSSNFTARSLAVNASGATDFRGLVGNTFALASLSMSAGGSTRFHAGTVTTPTVRTTGAQTYGNPVELVAVAAGQSRVFTSTASGNIAFNGSIDASGVAPDFIVNTAGTTTLGGTIGGTSALNSLLTDNPGSLVLTSPLVHTLGQQRFDDATATHSGSTLLRTTNANSGFLGAVNSSGTIAFDLGTGSAAIANAANELDTIGFLSAGDALVRDLTSLVLASSNLSVSLDVTAGGTLTQTGAIVVPQLRATTNLPGGAGIALTNTGNDVDQVWLTSTGPSGPGGFIFFNDLDSLQVNSISTAASATIDASGPLVVAGSLDASRLQLRSTGSDLTLNAGATLSTTDPGNGIVLSAAGRFINQGATLNTGAGRWLIYSADPALNTFGGLASGNTPIWGESFASLPPGAVTATGNRYIFGTSQMLTFTSTDLAKIYGDDATAAVAGAWTVTGFNTNTLGGAILADTAATTFTGAPSVVSLGSPATAPVAGSPYAIDIASGSLVSTSGYDFSFVSSGELTVNPLGITVVANDATKVYGDVDPLLTYIATGLVGSDTLSGSLTRDAGENVAGSPYAITQGTLANSNYTIAFTNGEFAITRRPITVTAEDQTRMMGLPDPPFTYTVANLVAGDVLSGALTREPGETAAGSPYAILQGTVTDASNPNYAISFVPGDLTITPSTVALDNRALQVGLERAPQGPFTPGCFAKSDEDRLGKEFAKAQQRLDRAGKSPRAKASGVCRIASL